MGDSSTGRVERGFHFSFLACLVSRHCCAIQQTIPDNWDRGSCYLKINLFDRITSLTTWK